MKNWMRYLFALITLTTGQAYAVSGTWSYVGQAGFSADAVYNIGISLALDSSGTPYVAYSDSASGLLKASVMKFSGGSWQQVGAAGFSAGAEPYTSLAIDSSGTPYAAYMNSPVTFPFYFTGGVMRFNGTSWEQVGQAGFATGKMHFISLAIDSSGKPYVAYLDAADGGKISVMRFNGTSWEQVGQACFSAGQAAYIRLALDSSGTPYVAYKDYAANAGKISVMRFNGTSWEQVGQAGFSAGKAEFISLAIDSSGTPYVTYTDCINNYYFKPSVMRFNGTSWEQVGQAGFYASATIVASTSLAIDSNDTPYVAYMDVTKGSKASVMRFNGTSWEQVGQAGFSVGLASHPILAIDRSGTPYIAYKDGTTGYKISVMRFMSPNQAHAPVAEAGLNQAIVTLGTSVQLDGSQSWDEDGDTLAYSWSFVSTPEGSNAALSNPAAVKPTFQVDKHGDYTIQLTVSDGKASSTDQVLVSFANIAPVASAGQNQSAVQGETVCFDGSGSADANGDPLTYTWTLTAPADSSAVLNDPSAEKPCISTDLPGTYAVSLIVNDGAVDSTASTAEVVAVSYRDALAETLQQAIEAVNALDPAVLNNKNNQNALTNQLNAALALADQGSYADALVQLQDTLGKTNGCTEAGAPDKNDWIKDCVNQATVYPLLQEAIGYLESMM